MKKEINPGLFFVVIAAFILLAGFFMWRHVGNSDDSASAEEARYRQTEQWAKENNVDLRKDPMMAPLYYKYHPEEKRPADVRESNGTLSGPMFPGGQTPGGAAPAAASDPGR